MEKQKLQQQLEELQETAALENNARLLELQKENLRLSKKVESLQESSSKVHNSQECTVLYYWVQFHGDNLR